jgi:4-alpha-glucanotransferase
VANQPWLPDIARFGARKEAHGWGPWWAWPDSVKSRLPADVQQVDRQLGAAIDAWKAVAWLFESQWAAIRQHAARRNIRIIGDLPLYVAVDSVEVWSRPELFRLDSTGEPAVVAGCPPDAFTPLGQRWGNPMYDWSSHQHEDFSWWVNRLERLLHRVHLVRIDHFRGLSAGWAIPAGATDARGGRWSAAPGLALFATLQRALGLPLPLIAEDLGHLDKAVHDLRRMSGIPGMRVLQFGFDGQPNNPHHPDSVTADCIVYPGTHDNDTVAGWWHAASPSTRSEVCDTLGCAEHEAPLAVVHAALDSGGNGAIVPAQDLLGLGSEARLNTPGSAEGNWSWRMSSDQLRGLDASAWRDVLESTGRRRPPKQG